MTTTTNTNDLPHKVPATELDAVLIRDGSHKGTLVTKLDDDQYRFDCLDGSFKPVTRERCVLVELADPVLDEFGYEVSDWQTSLPDDATVGCDLEGNGYALLGLDHGQEVDERCGSVLWDSDESDEE